MPDGSFVRYHGWGDTPSVLMNLIRSQCVVVRVKRLKVLATCRELWVSGKPSSQSARGVDIPPTTCICFFWLLMFDWGNTCCKGNQEYGFCSRATDVCLARVMCVCSCSRLWWLWSTSRNERQTVASGRPFGVPSVWVRFTLQGWKFDSESSVSHEDWDCLIPLPHRVTRAMLWLLKMMFG
jgi:hypothetical protein